MAASQKSSRNGMHGASRAASYSGSELDFRSYKGVAVLGPVIAACAPIAMTCHDRVVKAKG